MADRTAAELFGTIFKLLDEEISDPAKRRALAARFWDMQRDYDFSPYQMYVDVALKNLELARVAVDPDYPGDGPVCVYGPTWKET